MNAFVWYNQPTTEDKRGEDYHFTGFVNLKKIETAFNEPNVEVYFCGPVEFMQYAAHQLLELGIPQERLHYECFGPHKVI